MKEKTTYSLLAAVLLFTFVGCTLPDDDRSASHSTAQPQDGEWAWELTNEQAIKITRGERNLFTLNGVESETFTSDVSMLFGFFDFFKDNIQKKQLRFKKVGESFSLVRGAVEYGELNIAQTDNGNLQIRINMNGNQNQAIRVLFSKEDSDQFWGFGEQYNYIDFGGRQVPIWVQEQGVGRSGSPLLPFQGTLTDSYFPMPYFIDPKAGKGFLVENTEYALFDLGHKDKQTWSVEIWNGKEVSLQLLPGPKPVDVVQELTGIVGRAKSAPPDWAFSGVWLGAQGGTEVVRARIENASAHGIPVSAAWVQDWIGQRDFGLGNSGVKYRWIHDEGYYPDLDELIDDLAEDGVRFLGYFNPFVVPAYELYEFGEENGYLIRNEYGQPYDFLIITFPGTLLDLTNQAAVDWFQGYARDAVALGMKGWMADFGEWLPYDAKLHNAQAPGYHNLYPTEWHRANREVLEEAYPDGDFVLLTRSGYTGEHEVAQVVWAGDQEASWSKLDGLPTVVTAGLTLSLAGIPFFTHDIAGFSGGPSTQELYMRWTELGAFTPIMRTHEGLQKDANHNFDSDAATLAHYKKFSLIHEAMAPYFIQLAQEAVETGLPIIRHTMMVDPDWEYSYLAHSQWMLGEDLVFAPVISEGAKRVVVTLPEGKWEHLLTGRTFNGRCIYEVAAELGKPAIFVRRGKMKPVVSNVREIYNEQ